MKATFATLLFSSALFAVLFGGRARGGSAPPLANPWQPSPSNLPPVPTVPSVPTEPPKPRATPKTVKVQALHRYEVVADVLPVDGVSLRTAASKLLDALRLEDADLKGAEPLEREGVGKVTRVTFQVNSLINNEFPLDRQISTAGVGSVWIVSLKDVT
jgi:hypothetical protein